MGRRTSTKEIRTLQDHIDAIYALAFTPDGKRLVSGAADRSVKIWDIATGASGSIRSPTRRTASTASRSRPDGTRVAAGGLDKTIRIWRLGANAGTLENTLIAHEDAILKVAWSPDGKYLASASADRTISLFLAADLSEVRTFAKLPDWAFGLEFSPNGKSLAAGLFNGALQFYEVDHDRMVAAK